MDPATEQQESQQPEAPQDLSLGEELEAMHDNLDGAFADDLEEELSGDGETTIEDVQDAIEELPPEEVPEWNEPAPERWSAELKEVYNNLPPQARQAMLDGIYKPMQREYTRSTQELAGMRNTVEPMLRFVNENRNEFQRYGIDPMQAFNTQAAWALHMLKVGPEQGIRDYAAAYGQSNLLAGQPDNSPEEFLTPVERALKTQLEQLQQQVAGTAQTQQSWQLQQARRQQMAHAHAVQNELLSFSNEMVDGKPAHPHMKKVAPAIVGLIRGGLVKRVDDYGQVLPIKSVMKQAYDMACMMDPTINSVAPGSRQAARAKAAQNLGVVANSPAGRVDTDALSLQEDLERTFEKLDKKVG